MTTSASIDAGRVATTVDQAVTYERHQTCRTTVALLVADQHHVAIDVLTRGVRRQARIAGCGDAQIPVLQPTRFRGYVVYVDGRQVSR